MGKRTDPPPAGTPPVGAREILAAASLAGLLVLAVFLTTPLTEHNRGYDFDGQFYAALSCPQRYPAQLSRVSPYCWRVLSPALAGLFPFDPIESFTVLAFLADWTSLVLLYLLLRKTGLGRRASAFGTLLYAGSFWTLKFSFYAPCYIDSHMQAIALAVLLLMTLGKYAPLPLLLAVGVLQKETLLFLVPVVFVHYASRRGRWLAPRSLAYLAALVAAPGVALVLVRWQIQSVQPLVTREAFFGHFRSLGNPDYLERVALELWAGLGLLLPLLVLRIRAAARFLRARPWWLTMLLLGGVLLFGGIDKGRLLLPALPVLVLVIVSAYRDLVESGRPIAWAWLALTLVAQFYLGNYLTPVGPYPDYLRRVVAIHAERPFFHTWIRLAVVGAAWAAATAAALALRRRNFFGEGERRKP